MQLAQLKQRKNGEYQRFIDDKSGSERATERPHIKRHRSKRSWSRGCDGPIAVDAPRWLCNTFFGHNFFLVRFQVFGIYINIYSFFFLRCHDFFHCWFALLSLTLALPFLFKSFMIFVDTFLLRIINKETRKRISSKKWAMPCWNIH